MTLRKERLFASSERILDAQMVVNAPSENVAPDLRLVVLTPQHIVRLPTECGCSGSRCRALPLMSEVAASRDPRGEVVQTGVDGMNAFLPG